MRISVVTPKNMYRYLPMSYKSSTGKAVMPYYSASGDDDHPEPISKPISGAYADNNGMQ